MTTSCLPHTDESLQRLFGVVPGRVLLVCLYVLSVLVCACLYCTGLHYTGLYPTVQYLPFIYVL